MRWMSCSAPRTSARDLVGGQRGEVGMADRVVGEPVPGIGDGPRRGGELLDEGTCEKERPGHPLGGQGGQDWPDRVGVGSGIEGQRNHPAAGGNSLDVLTQQAGRKSRRPCGTGLRRGLVRRHLVRRHLVRRHLVRRLRLGWLRFGRHLPAFGRHEGRGGLFGWRHGCGGTTVAARTVAVGGCRAVAPRLTARHQDQQEECRGKPGPAASPAPECDHGFLQAQCGWPATSTHRAVAPLSHGPIVPPSNSRGRRP